MQAQLDAQIAARQQEMLAQQQELFARQQQMEARWQAEWQEFLRQQEADRQRLEQALSYIQTLGASIGHSPPQFSPLPLPPRARAATPTPVSDLTIL